MLAKLKEIGVPVLVIAAALVYTGMIQAGPKAPDFIKPKA